MIVSFKHKGLRRFFEKGNISAIQSAHAKRLHRFLTLINRTTREAELAVKLAEAINPGPKVETWPSMQSGYDAWHAKHDVDVSYIHTYNEQELKEKRA